MRALLVDDSRFIRCYLRSLLTAHGVECVEASDGEQALQCLYNGGGFSVALLDWNMPAMSGLDLLLAVRADHALDSMKVLMVTTEAANDHILTALESGADEYLVKPFDEAGLLQKLRMAGVAGL